MERKYVLSRLYVGASGPIYYGMRRKGETRKGVVSRVVDLAVCYYYIPWAALICMCVDYIVVG